MGSFLIHSTVIALGLTPRSHQAIQAGPPTQVGLATLDWVVGSGGSKGFSRL